VSTRHLARAALYAALYAALTLAPILLVSGYCVFLPASLLVRADAASDRQEAGVFAVPAGAEPAPAPSQYWYFCNASKAYYPYVRECPSGWQRVTPQPPQP